MQFREVIPDENYDTLRLASTEGRWELGLYRVIYGWRIRMGQTDDVGVELDYCGGANLTDCLVILKLVIKALATVPESITGNDLFNFFPHQTKRPMANDPECFRALTELAYKETPTHV